MARPAEYPFAWPTVDGGDRQMSRHASTGARAQQRAHPQIPGSRDHLWPAGRVNYTVGLLLSPANRSACPVVTALDPDRSRTRRVGRIPDGMTEPLLPASRDSSQTRQDDRSRKSSGGARGPVGHGRLRAEPGRIRYRWPRELEPASALDEWSWSSSRS